MQLTPSITTAQQARGLRLRTPRLLLLESDEGHAQALAEQLTDDDMDVVVADSAAMAHSRLRSGRADVVLVRVSLGEGSGYAVVDHLRESGSIGAHCPVIAFSDRAEEDDRLRALRRGCVDFLALPLFYPELHARLGLALTRVPATARNRAEAIEVVGGLLIDVESGTVSLGGQFLGLSARETELLVALAADPTRVVPKAELMREVWGIEYRATRTLDSHACRLRKKLAEAGGDYVHNKWGIGYRLLRFPTVE